MKDILTEREASYDKVLAAEPGRGLLTEIVPGDRININTADRSELERLNGIGKVLSQRIIDYREEQGGFKTAEELKKVDGISESTYAQVRGYITVED